MDVGYTGIFRCCALSATSLPALSSDQKDASFISKITDVVAERAVRKNMVPPIFFENFREMFKDGVVQVCCVELECVGFNHGLYGNLHNTPTAQLPKKATEPQGADSGAANQAGKGKRKAPAGHMPQGGTGGPPQKKPKKGPK